jgi:elongation factor G
MEPKPGVTRIAAEVPMAEVLDYARDLRAITGGRGEYTVAFERYDELPPHLAERVAADSGAAAEQLAG